MAWSEKAETDSTQALRAIALRYPEANEGIACKGTAAEGPRFDARNKAFLFLRLAGESYVAMVKLGESQGEAAELGSRDGVSVKVGAGGWTTIIFDSSEAPLGVLEKWIDESYRLVAPKALVATLPGSDLPAAQEPRSGKKPTAKKAAAKKSATKRRTTS